MLSVLLPFRDAEGTIQEALTSVLAETVVDEVVCVDDGSTDACRSVVEAIASRDARVVLTETHGGGVGVAAALVEALRLARGELIGRMDADDLSLPGRFAASLRKLEEDRDLAAVACQVRAFPDPGDGMRAYVDWQNSLVSSEDVRREIFIESPLCHPATTFRRSALEAVGGFRDAPWAEDFDLFLRLDAAGHRMAKVREILFEWRMHPQRVTVRDPRCSLEALTRARAAYLGHRLEQHGGRRHVQWGAGKTGRRLARALEAHGVLPQLFVDIDPRKIGRTARGRVIAAPTALDGARDFVVVAVGARGARDVIRARLVPLGFVEGETFIFAA